MPSWWLGLIIEFFGGALAAILIFLWLRNRFGKD